MTTFFLVRHASHDLLGRVLAGRMAGVGLNAHGCREAHCVGQRLVGDSLTGLFTSPMQRAQETAAPIGEACGLAPESMAALDEIDMGDWTGQSFDSLRDDPAVKVWNDNRAAACPPGGEAMVKVQRRIVGCLEALQRARPEGRLALVSHGDVLKAAVAHYLGLSLDHLPKFDIDPASVTTLVAGDWGARLLCLNDRVRVSDIAGDTLQVAQERGLRRMSAFPKPHG